MKKEKNDEFENNINNIMSLGEIELDAGGIREAQKNIEAVLKSETKCFQQKRERKSEKICLFLSNMHLF